MSTNTRAHVFDLLFLVPTVWAHHHTSDENERTFDRTMVDFCEVCSARVEALLDEGKLCEKHPTAYFELPEKGRPAFCEDCWLEANREVRS